MVGRLEHQTVSRAGAVVSVVTAKTSRARASGADSAVMVDERLLLRASAERVALFQARVSALFERLPMLSGFHVTEDLRAVAIGVHTWPGWEPPPAFAEEITAALELLIVDGAEEAAVLLRGTTFARQLH